MLTLLLVEMDQKYKHLPHTVLAADQVAHHPVPQQPIVVLVVLMVEPVAVVV
jgi:hypothetical protein